MIHIKVLTCRHIWRTGTTLTHLATVFIRVGECSEGKDSSNCEELHGWLDVVATIEIVLVWLCVNEIYETNSSSKSARYAKQREEFGSNIMEESGEVAVLDKEGFGYCSLFLRLVRLMFISRVACSCQIKWSPFLHWRSSVLKTYKIFKAKRGVRIKYYGGVAVLIKRGSDIAHCFRLRHSLFISRVAC